MVSKYNVQRHFGGSSDHLPSRDESTQAYDSYQGHQGAQLTKSASQPDMDRIVERATATPAKNQKLARPFGGWTEKRKSKKDNAGALKIRISEPQPILVPSHIPLRPLPHKHQGTEQAQLPLCRSPMVPEQALPSPSLKYTTIQRANLGKRHEALGSNPVATCLDNMDKKLPAQQVQCRRDSWPLSNGEADQSGEIASEPKPTANNEAEQMAKIKAERRKGRIFSSDEIPRDLYEFPDPEIWSGKHGQNMGNDGHIWEDAGIDDPVATDDYAPQIIFTEPEDDDREAKESNRKPEDRLNVDMVYRVLYNKQTKELRDCKATLKSLARLVADAEEADLNDGPNLEKALKTIISDRAKLFDLMPLARIVADDQSLPFGDFKELPDALRRILADRDNAKKMAEYHKTTATRLWQRMASSEREHGE